MMKTERILPVDLYNSVSTPELKLESSLKILYVKEGEDDKLLPLDSGTLVVICTGGTFRCKALHHLYEVAPGQLLLLASDDVTEVKPFHDTGFTFRKSCCSTGPVSSTAISLRTRSRKHGFICA